MFEGVVSRNTVQKGRKLWEKEKLLVTSNFSFSHTVSKRLVLQTRKKQGLVREKLKVAYGKGENAVYRHFLLFHVFKRSYCHRH